MFHTFNSQEEYKNHNGSAFIEIQYCNMSFQTTVKELVDVKNIQHWKNNSLYVYEDDGNIFYQEYSHIFSYGIHNNLKTGTVDLCGINYYSPILIDSIMERLSIEKPDDYEVLMAWLIRSKSYNGFYILGL